MDWFETILFLGIFFIETSALLDFGGVSYHIKRIIVTMKLRQNNKNLQTII